LQFQNPEKRKDENRKCGEILKVENIIWDCILLHKEIMARKYSFPPIINTNSKILILGSLPSVESLCKQQYYANPRNAFWHILYALFECEYEEDYSNRCTFALTHNLAIWDVCHSAEREGSADSKIKAIQPNDIAELLNDYPNIELILLNGKKAESEYLRHFKNLKIPASYVPSTSPALAAMNFAEKLESWHSAFLAPPHLLQFHALENLDIRLCDCPLSLCCKTIKYMKCVKRKISAT
jgi:hypoxanthine-DNA glycosylase